MRKSTLTLTVAALALAGLAIPTAASAAPTNAPQALKAPKIEQLFANGHTWSVERRAVTLETQPRIGIGSSVFTTGFRNKTVVVTDENGDQVCSSADNGYDQAGGSWECWADGSVLTVGKHVLTATAIAKNGTTSAPSKPVTVTVTGAAAVTPDEPVDPGFTVDPGDADATPAPGPVDPEFSAGTARPDVLSASVTEKDGEQNVSIRVRNIAGAEYHVQDPTGATHGVTLQGTDDALITYTLSSAFMRTAMIWVSQDGIDSEAVPVSFS